MKKIIISLTFCVPLFLHAQISHEETRGIHFETGAFTAMLAKAKKENKMIMVDAFTTWCGPCKWMAKEIFPNDTVAEFYNKNFINAGVDMEKGEGIDLAKKYEVRCYPTFLFIDGNGELLHRMSGGMPAKDFVALGVDAMNPEKQFTTCQKKYDSGNISADEMGAYVLMRGRSCMPVKDEMEKYFSTQSDTALTSQRNWSILYENSRNMNVDSRAFRYLIDHRDEYEKLYESKTADDGIVNNVIKHSYFYAMHTFIKNENMDGYNKLKEEVLKKNFSFSEEMIAEFDISLYKSEKDWNNYTQSAVKYIDKFKKEDYRVLNSMAWGFYENVSDKTMLAKAEEWAKHSVELHPEYFNYDTHAALLYKLGKKKEAQAAAEKAIELAKKDGNDYSGTQEMLEIIKKMK